MGKATRWLKTLFAFKKDSNKESPNAGMCHNPVTIPPNLSPTEATWLQSHCTKEQSKHAIAVAAATAAAADAAIAAAHAAVAVVKLTSNGRVKAPALFETLRERYAAVKIQSVFRGYLARKALRALRSLVKLQAVVRGFLVRKQAAATLHGMQALIRAQATVRSRRVRNRDSRFSCEFVSRKSLDNFDTRSAHSRRYSSTFEAIVDERAKIVEMDTISRPKSRSRSKSRSRRSNLSISESVMNDQSHYCLTHLSPFVHDSDWGMNGDECKSSTAQSTPKFSKRALVASEWTPNPSYMAKTQSFTAKVRSQSAPRQRSDGVTKRRVSLLEMMEARNSLSGVTMQPVVSFKNAVMRKLDGSREELGKGRNGYYNNAVRR